MYGAKTSSDGKAIKANGTAPVMAGRCVTDNKLIGLEMGTDQNGNVSTTQAYLSFEQSNGAIFKHTFWDSTESWGIDKMNSDMVHICTKIVSEEEYYSVIEEHGDGTFTGFIKAVSDHIISKAVGQMFDLKIIFKGNKDGKFFANFPKFPNFIDVAGNGDSLFKTNPTFDIYEIPAATAMGTGSNTTSAAADPLVF